MSPKETLLEQISNQIKNCNSCRLCKMRANAVPGAGHPNAKIVFIGEAPGFNEDRRGLPFVGKAGGLLEKLLHSLGLTRDQVWIGNIIKCRPPDNRDPLVDEIRACKPYLEAQIRAINPRMVVALGRFAMNHYLPDAKISKDHGVPKMLAGKVIYSIYHPAAALRSERVLSVLREDFLAIPKILEMSGGEIEPARVSKAVDDNQITLL